MPIGHPGASGSWSAVGQTRRFDDVRVTSAFPLIADVRQKARQVRNVPISEVNDPFDHLVGVRQHAGGTVMPSAFAVLRLITKVSLLASSIGRSPGLVPARISRHRCPHGESRPRGRWIGHQQAGAFPFRVYADHRLCRSGITLDMPRIGCERMIPFCRIGRKTSASLRNDQAH
jgi:hypothetical protein